MRWPALRPSPPEAPAPAWAALWASLIDLTLVLAVVVVAADRYAPPQDLPWKPLTLQAPLGMATRLKFEAAAADPERCRAVLRAGGVRFTEEPARSDGFCRVANALRLRGGTTPLSPAAPVMTCPEALAYAFWDRHVVQPAARDVLKTPVVRVDHYGTYACRAVAGGETPSQHAYANALDVAGFQTAGGRRVSVAAYFNQADPRGGFLHQVRDGACGWFRVVLSPDYNAAHRDHLHLDFSPFALCR